MIKGAAYLIALVALSPFLALVVQAMTGELSLFAHLWQTVLPTYLCNSLLLVIAVIFFSCLFALPPAWFLARYQFWGARFFQWALLLPLAMPAYLIAYVYTDLLDYAGPIQQQLRAWFAWQAGEYYFPEIRSLTGASLMLALVLFPYIYLLARAAFSQQSLNLQQAAQLLGCSAWQRFCRLHLPLARPAIVAGIALVAMETMADFATVSYFAVPTLTTAVYDTWLDYGSLSAAAKISVFILLLLFVFISSERFARRKQVLYQQQGGTPNCKINLSNQAQIGVIGFCSFLLFLAFILPCLILIHYALDYFAESFSAQFWRYAWHSFSLASLVAIFCLLASLGLLYQQRFAEHATDHWLSRLASLGYALPGTVMAIGLLILLSSLDFALNDLLLWFGVSEVGLVFSGSLFALVLALSLRFIAIALGSLEANYQKISPTLDQACFTLGQGRLVLFWRVHCPLLHKGMMVSLLLVFIEAMKELPAALLLRPIGYENLAIYVYQFVADEQLELAALAALVIVAVGLIPIIYLNASLDQRRDQRKKQRKQDKHHPSVYERSERGEYEIST